MKIARKLIKIFEGLWTEEYPAAEALKKYPNLYVHFSDMNKIGINPKKSHKDPFGIYFYKNSWLSNEDNWGGFQYGLVNDFYFIVELLTDKYKTLNLGAMTSAQAMRIARSNGWGDVLAAASKDRKALFKDSYMEPKSTRKAAAVFFTVADLLVNKPEVIDEIVRDQGINVLEKKWSWSQLFKGIDIMIDPGYGIIAHQEPNQAVCLNPLAYRVVQSGSNKPNHGRLGRNVAEMVLAKLGGEKTGIKNGLVQGKLDFEGSPVWLSLDPGRLKTEVTFFKNGRKVKQNLLTKYYMGQSTSSDVSSIAYAIKSFLEREEPEKTGEELDETGWNPELLEAFFRKMIKPRTGDTIDPMVIDGFQSVRYNRHTSNLSSWCFANINANGNVDLNITLEVKDHEPLDIKIENITLDDSDRIASETLSKIYGWIEKTFGNHSHWREMENAINRTAAFGAYCSPLGIVSPELGTV